MSEFGTTSQGQADAAAGTFIVIAAFNEATCIGRVVADVRRVYPNVVVVDDGSSDDTGMVARKGATWVLRHVINRGQGAALQTGLEFALKQGAEIIVTFDADGQHRVEDIARLIEPIRSGACEIVLGSRFLGEAINLPATRRATLKLAILFTWIFSGLRLTDTHNGLRAFSRKAAEQVQIRCDGMAHASEVIDIVRRTELPFIEVPVQIEYTEYSLAKGQQARHAIRVALNYLIGRIFP